MQILRFPDILPLGKQDPSVRDVVVSISEGDRQDTRV